jgi:hypothetical protein
MPVAGTRLRSLGSVLMYRRKLLVGMAAGVIVLVFGIGCNRSPQSREAAYLKRGLNLQHIKTTR